jgi:hypothetical protein
MFAFFNNQDEPTLEVATSDELAQREAYRTKTKSIEAELKKYAESIAPKQGAWEDSLNAEQRGKLKDEVQTALLLLPDQRNEEQKKAAHTAFLEHDTGYKQLQKKLDKFKKDEPRITSTMVLEERAKPRESYVFVKGDFTRKGDPVTPAGLRVLNPMPEKNGPNRLDLARWIVDPQNPLAARVQVNRIWQQYFGRGLVETENDFGTQGSQPTHPELLDWLATELIAQKWGQKAMHRLIVTSATYRQSSKVRPELANIDANNRLLARQSRLRLDSEIVRDVCLSATGLLNPKIGGPSVYPPQPNGVMTLGQSKREWTPDSGADRYRRGMYTFFWRATPHPALMVFDSPDGMSACTRRPRSNTPLQALTLLNDQAYVEFAQALSARVLKSKPKSNGDLVEVAFRLCLSRKPSAAEKSRLTDLLNKELGVFANAPQEVSALLSDKKYAMLDAKEFAAWTTVSRVLLNLDETITRE